MQTCQRERNTYLILPRTLEHRRLRLEAEYPGRPTEMRLQNLAHVHSTGNAKRIEHQIDRRTVGQEWHVLFRNDSRNDAFVPVATCHLVANCNFALLGQIYFDQLYHTWWQFIRLEDLVDLVFGLLL